MQVRPNRIFWRAVLALSLAALMAMAAAACGDDSTTTRPTTNDTAVSTATPGSTTTSPGSATSAVNSGNSSVPSDIGKGDNAQLTGAGSTFGAPIYQAWADDYNKNVASGVKLNYQPVGSGAGIQQFTAKTVDFGASDAPMSDDETSKAPDVQHVPTVIGGVVLTYNVSGVTNPLKLDGMTIANIYMGKITKWNDDTIAKLNPGVTLPDKDIQVAFRSDSSGTSYVFTDYLSKVDPGFKSAIGATKAPAFPVGQGGQGSDGVTAVVKNTPNAIGYVELNYALTNKLAYADIENKAGKFVTPTIQSVSAAAEGVTIPDGYKVSITDADGDGSYPIATFTYLLVYKSIGKCSQQTPLADFLWWTVTDSAAQKDITNLNYSPLPDSLKSRVMDTIKSLKCDDGSKPSLEGS